MSKIKGFLCLLITAALIMVLNVRWGTSPPLGKFLSPQHGFWQNAEPAGYDFSEDLHFNHLKGKATVYFDDRLVPHVFAENDEDAYFVQGFLHAKFRLWQMEFQTMAAAGRISEILGYDERYLRFDREQRRLGMTYAAENCLKEMEADKRTKPFYDAYTAGVNAYIHTLTKSSLPLEYKLLDYKPEEWSNLKIALLLKQLSKTLAGYDRDLEFTNMKSVFSEREMRLLFPQVPDSLLPIVPKGTTFGKPFTVAKPATADSLYIKLQPDTAAAKESGKPKKKWFTKPKKFGRPKELIKPNPANGSNNWAVSGRKTTSGAPILCNDPHLELTFPSIWYEMQLSTPGMNTYGATLPGAPCVIIGFNDSIAFGFTNAQRDVKDYYRIRFKDASKSQYWYNGKWEQASLRVEEIKVRNKPAVTDTVAYTAFGPVMYDESFSNEATLNDALAVRWAAHDPSNDGAMWFYLNRAKNYSDYRQAITIYTCPGQNILFASKTGDIALWQQGKFPLRWYRQGLYVMPGEDTAYRWKDYIPYEENPHLLNPAEGFVQSANQRPADTAYHYFIPGNYINARGVTIVNKLRQLQKVSVRDMMSLQNSFYSSQAADAVPLLLKYVKDSAFSQKEKEYLGEVRKWDFNTDAGSVAATIYQTWFDSLETAIWNDDYSRITGPAVLPDENTTLELILKDSALKYIDDITTPQKETLEHQVTQSFREAVADLGRENDIAWGKHKKPAIYHLLRTKVLPFARTGLNMGGWSTAVNAMKTSHGPSWRMIVHLAGSTEAYGIYPGGQSGNPGSPFYDTFTDAWAAGKYYPLWMMKESEAGDRRVRSKMNFK